MDSSQILTEEVSLSIINGFRKIRQNSSENELDLDGSKLKLIVSSSVEPAAISGEDNFSSEIHSVDLEWKEVDSKVRKLNFILKIVPNVRSEDQIKLKKEAEMYSKAFPEFQNLQEKLNIREDLKIQAWPDCYYVESNYFALENLKTSGYKMLNRKEALLDFQHTVLALRSLAKLHALSFAKFGGSRDAILEAFPVLKHGPLEAGTEAAKSTGYFISSQIKSEAEFWEKNGEPEVVSKLEKLSKLDFATVLSDLIEKDVQLAVINHGDGWINNLMFSYQLDGPKYVKFVDFQVAMASSRFIDIFHLLFTSVQLPVLRKHEGDLLPAYFQEFTSVSNVLGMKTEEMGLTLKAFLEEADQFRFYGVSLGLMLAPLLLPGKEGMEKVKYIVSEQLPNCKNDFLSSQFQ